MSYRCGFRRTNRALVQVWLPKEESSLPSTSIQLCQLHGRFKTGADTTCGTWSMPSLSPMLMFLRCRWSCLLAGPCAIQRLRPIPTCRFSSTRSLYRPSHNDKPTKSRMSDHHLALLGIHASAQCAHNDILLPPSFSPLAKDTAIWPLSALPR